MSSAADLTFDASVHEYRLQGERLPSVTEILESTGISFDYDSLGNGPHAQALAYRRALGTAVHSDCHAFDDDVLDWDTVDPVVRPYVDAWRFVRLNQELVPVVRERRVFHPHYRYAGTMDGIFENPSTGIQVLVDIKTGDPEASAAHFQTAAYLAAYLADHEESPHRTIHRMAVQLCPDAVVPYRVFPYTEQSRDFRKFCAFLTTYHEQYVRRVAA